MQLNLIVLRWSARTPYVLTVLIALLAGAVTAISPCALPVLPILLSTSATGGKLRPLGVIFGLVITFTIVVAGLGAALVALGLPDDVLRYIAVVIIFVMGLGLLIPKLREKAEAPFYRLGRYGPKQQGEGFVSGIPVGAAMACVYAPCAGPILAAVIATAAQEGSSIGVILVAFAYAVGTGFSMFFIMLGGRKLTTKISVNSKRLQQGFGALLIVCAVVFATSLDVQFQQTIADKLPGFVVNPTGDLEKSVNKDTDKLVGRETRAETSGLEDLGVAPAIAGISAWRNTSGNKPLTARDTKNQVVLLDFWTYSCINCLRNLPGIKQLYARYKDAGLTVVGVHTPEFAFERQQSNIDKAIKDLGVKYPVATDPDYTTWDNFQNSAWPASYLIDSKGKLRYVSRGEGQIGATEEAIRSLLKDAGNKLPPRVGDKSTRASAVSVTPETYFGLARRDGVVNSQAKAGPTNYKLEHNLNLNEFSLGGIWSSDPQKIIAGAGAKLNGSVSAANVYIVAAAPMGTGKAGWLKVHLKGAKLGDDVKNGRIAVSGQRLYSVAKRSSAGPIELQIDASRGTQVFTFSFG